MIGTCENCDRENVPVSHCRMSDMETTQCFLCQGDTDPDPHGELEGPVITPMGWKTYSITQEQMDRLVGAAHSGGLLGGDAAYGACLTVGAILAEIAFKEGFDKSPGSAPEDDTNSRT